jgi:hypothetical protein
METCSTPVSRSGKGQIIRTVKDETIIFRIIWRLLFHTIRRTTQQTPPWMICEFKLPNPNRCRIKLMQKRLASIHGIAALGEKSRI